MQYHWETYQKRRVKHTRKDLQCSCFHIQHFWLLSTVQVIHVAWINGNNYSEFWCAYWNTERIGKSISDMHLFTWFFVFHFLSEHFWTIACNCCCLSSCSWQPAGNTGDYIGITVEPPIRETLCKGHLLQHNANTLVYYFTSEIGTTSLQGTELLPLFRGSTVYRHRKSCV